VDGIDAMVAPAVLITLGSLLANGILAASTAVLGNLRSLAGERYELLHPASISAKDQKRSSSSTAATTSRPAGTSPF
jgi:hypothetical protein